MIQETEIGEDLLSALMDGQLHGEEFARIVELLGHDQEACSSWRAYHVAGDVLRCGESIVGSDEAVFLQRLKVRLRQEPSPARRPDAVGPAPVEEMAGAAANDSSVRWKWLAGLASVAAVAVIAWQIGAVVFDPPDGKLVMMRDPQLDALLAAHRQSGGGSALQMSAGFLRNATFEGANR